MLNHTFYTHIDESSYKACLNLKSDWNSSPETAIQIKRNLSDRTVKIRVVDEAQIDSMGVEKNYQNITLSLEDATNFVFQLIDSLKKVNNYSNSIFKEFLKEENLLINFSYIKWHAEGKLDKSIKWDFSKVISSTSSCEETVINFPASYYDCMLCFRFKEGSILNFCNILAFNIYLMMGNGHEKVEFLKVILDCNTSTTYKLVRQKGPHL